MVAGWPSGGEAVKPRDGTSRSVRAYAAARENSGARPRCEPERAPGWGTRISVPVVRLERAEAIRVHRGRSQRDHLVHDAGPGERRLDPGLLVPADRVAPAILRDVLHQAHHDRAAHPEPGIGVR